MQGNAPHLPRNGVSAGSSAPASACLSWYSSSPATSESWLAGPCSPAVKGGSKTVQNRGHEGSHTLNAWFCSVRLSVEADALGCVSWTHLLLVCLFCMSNVFARSWATSPKYLGQLYRWSSCPLQGSPQNSPFQFLSCLTPVGLFVSTPGFLPKAKPWWKGGSRVSPSATLDPCKTQELLGSPIQQ